MNYGYHDGLHSKLGAVTQSLESFLEAFVCTYLSKYAHTITKIQSCLQVSESTRDEWLYSIPRVPRSFQ